MDHETHPHTHVHIFTVIKIQTDRSNQPLTKTTHSDEDSDRLVNQTTNTPSTHINSDEESDTLVSQTTNTPNTHTNSDEDSNRLVNQTTNTPSTHTMHSLQTHGDEYAHRSVN